MSESGQKVSEGSTKPPGFRTPHYFYIYSISICDFGAIQTPRAEIYIFTTRTPYKISSRILVFASLRTGIFTVKCACPEPSRQISPQDLSQPARWRLQNDSARLFTPDHIYFEAVKVDRAGSGMLVPGCSCDETEICIAKRIISDRYLYFG